MLAGGICDSGSSSSWLSMPSSTRHFEGGVRALVATITREQAVEEFCRWRRWRRWWPRGSRPVGLELVHLPVHHFVVGLVLEPEGRKQELDVAVDGVDGTVKRFDAAVDLSLTDAGREVLCEPLVDEEESRARLDEELPVQVLQPALRHRGRVLVEQVRRADAVGYPYWIEHSRRGSHRGFRALDGLTRARVGARGRAAILAALLRSRRRHGE